MKGVNRVGSAWVLTLLLIATGWLTACNPALVMPATPTLMALAYLPTVAPSPTSTAPAPSATPTLPPPLPAALPATADSIERVSLDLPATPTSPPPGARAVNVSLLDVPVMPSAAEILEWRPPAVPVPHSLHPNDHYWLRRPIPSGRVDWGLDWYPYGGNGGGVWHTHHGMDFPNDPGTPVLAAGDGVVIEVKDDWYPVYIVTSPEVTSTVTGEATASPAEYDAAMGPLEEQPTEETPVRRVAGPYGNYVIIHHDWGWHGQPVYTVYAHLLEVFVQEGERVSAGDLIGGVGSTGNSSGPHLHLEVRLGENDYNHTLNPALWLAPYEGWGTLAGRITTARGTLLYNAVVTIFARSLEGYRDLDDFEPRTVTSYANNQVNPDEQWAENFVMADLPAGEYRLVVRAGGERLETAVSIHQGVTTFVRLHTSVAPTPTATLLPTPES